MTFQQPLPCSKEFESITPIITTTSNSLVHEWQVASTEDPDGSSAMFELMPWHLGLPS